MEKTMRFSVINRIVMMAIASIVAVLCIIGFSVQAHAETTASGTWGTCAWDIDDKDVLTFHEGTLKDFGLINGSRPNSPWWATIAPPGKPLPNTSSANHVQSVRTEGTVVFPKNCMLMFLDFESVKSVDLSNVDTSSTTNMQSMFNACGSLEEVNLSSFDTRNVTDITYMFATCKNIKKLSLGEGFVSLEGTGLRDAYWKLLGSDMTPLSTSELIETWDPATMAGTWVDVEYEESYLPVDPSLGNSTITIETEASTINVTVPTNAAFVFKADGTNVYPSNYEITNNNGLTAILLNSIDFEGVNGWSLTTEDDTFQADVKKFALNMGLKNKTLSVVDVNDGVSFSGDTEIKIAPQSSKTLGFDAKRGVFSEPVTTENAMEMTMHFDWERL